MGLPGIALFSWTMVMLKWREVRHATRRNRPIKNTLRHYPKTIAFCSLLIFLDLEQGYLHYHGQGNSWKRLSDSLTWYAGVGIVICSYLFAQGLKVFWRLITGNLVLKELDKDLANAFRSMTVWLMF